MTTRPASRFSLSHDNSTRLLPKNTSQILIWYDDTYHTIQTTYFGSCFCSNQYQRCHREAALSLSAAVDGGAVPRPEQRRRPSLERSSTTPESTGGPGAAQAAGAAAEGSARNSNSNSNSDSSTRKSSDGGGGDKKIFPAPALRKRAMSATLLKVREAMPSSSGNKKDLVQWFLPSEKNRKEALIESAQAAADAAEEARKACLACWETLRSSIYGAIQVCGVCGFDGGGGGACTCVCARAPVRRNACFFFLHCCLLVVFLVVCCAWRFGRLSCGCMSTLSK